MNNKIKIKGHEHVKNVSAIYICNSNGIQIPEEFGNGKWYSISGGKLVFDYHSLEWKLKTKNNFLTYGIVGYDKKTEKVKLGFFTYTKANNVDCVLQCKRLEKRIKGVRFGRLENVVILKCLVKAIENNNFLYNRYGGTTLGMYVDVNIKERELAPIYEYDKINNYKFKRDYGYRYSIADHYCINEIQESVNDVEFNADLSHIYDLISPLSYGFEIETTRGKMPDHKIWRNGFIPLRDGSIQGDEFTSIPFFNETGINSLRDLQSSLSECSIDKFCSLHIHLGNTKLSDDELVAFYMLNYQIQQEIFDFLPPYKRSEYYFAEKAQNGNGAVKDHCKPFRTLGFYIDDSTLSEKYDTICDFVNPYCNDEDENGEMKKWDEYSRYFSVNLLPYIKNGSTVEFRSHEPTLNFQKILNWLLIIAATVKYTKKNKEYILNKNKISLTDVLNVYSTDEFGTKVSKYLKDYVKFRTLQFVRLHIQGDYNSDAFLYNDKSFKFQEEIFKEILENKWQKKLTEQEIEQKEIIMNDN